MSLFVRDGYVYYIERGNNEIDEHFFARSNFIVSQKPKTEAEYEHAVKYSKIYINIKFLKCKYNQEIVDELNKINLQINLDARV